MEANINLLPTKAITGILVDEATGEPDADREVQVSVDIQYKDGSSTQAFQRTARTNDRGEFRVEGLAQNQNYDIHRVLVDSSNEDSESSQRVLTFQADVTGLQDLGTIRVEQEK